MPRLSTETYGAGDMSWLASDHGIFNCDTVLLDISTFTAEDHYPDGYIPSGTAVAEVSGVLVPYTVAEATTTGAGILAGHILTDQPVVGTKDFAVPVFRHGKVVEANVPGTFTAPAAAAKKAASSIIYV